MVGWYRAEALLYIVMYRVFLLDGGKNMALTVNAKKVLTIKKFLEKYYQISCDDKMTHNQLREFMNEKGITLPKRMNFDSVKKEDLIRNKVILAKDKKGNVIPYSEVTNLNGLLLELQNSKQNNPKNLRKIREALLQEMGYETFNDGTISAQKPLLYEEYEEDITCKINRSKTKIHYRKRGCIYK